MAKVKVLNAADIKQILDYPSVINVVEDAYKEKSNRTAEIWPMVYNAFSDDADMDIRSGSVKDKNIFGNKLLAWFGANSNVNKPELNGIVTLYSQTDGFPIALVNAPSLTGYRTGAAAAVASKALANQDAEHLLMVGAGNQSLYQIMGQLLVLPKINQVMIYDPLNDAQAQKLAQSANDSLNELFSTAIKSFMPEVAEKITQRLANVEFSAVSNIEEATKEAQVIVTATPSTKPMVNADWVQKGTHINAIGADMEGKQELDDHLFDKNNSFVDDVEQAINVGETQNPIKDGLISKADVKEIGDVLTGQADGRENDKEITIFDSTGIALQDLEAANLALVNADKFNIGQEVEL